MLIIHPKSYTMPNPEQLQQLKDKLAAYTSSRNKSFTDEELEQLARLALFYTNLSTATMSYHQALEQAGLSLDSFASVLSRLSGGDKRRQANLLNMLGNFQKQGETKTAEIPEAPQRPDLSSHSHLAPPRASTTADTNRGTPHDWMDGTDWAGEHSADDEPDYPAE